MCGWGKRVATHRLIDCCTAAATTDWTFCGCCGASSSSAPGTMTGATRNGQVGTKILYQQWGWWFTWRQDPRTINIALIKSPPFVNWKVFFATAAARSFVTRQCGGRQPTTDSIGDRRRRRKSTSHEEKSFAASGFGRQRFVMKIDDSDWNVDRTEWGATRWKWDETKMSRSLLVWWGCDDDEGEIRLHELG